MPSKLQQAINLSRKTGDRIIVFDSARSEEPYVVMGLEEYEKLVMGRNEVRGLTEDELLDKMNRDIAIWKSEQEPGYWSTYDPEEKTRTELTPVGDIIEEKYNTKETDSELKPKKNNPWAIPRDRRAGAEEVVEEDEPF